MDGNDLTGTSCSARGGGEISPWRWLEILELCNVEYSMACANLANGVRNSGSGVCKSGVRFHPCSSPGRRETSRGGSSGEASATWFLRPRGDGETARRGNEKKHAICPAVYRLPDGSLMMLLANPNSRLDKQAIVATSGCDGGRRSSSSPVQSREHTQARGRRREANAPDGRKRCPFSRPWRKRASFSARRMGW